MYTKIVHKQLSITHALPLSKLSAVLHVDLVFSMLCLTIVSCSVQLLQTDIQYQLINSWSIACCLSLSLRLAFIISADIVSMQLQEEINQIPLFVPNINGILINNEMNEHTIKKQTIKSLLLEMAERSTFEQV